LTWALQVVATVLEQHLIVEFASDHRLRKELQIKPAAVDAEILVDLEIPGLRGRAYHPTFNRAFWRHIDFSVHAINTGPLLEMMRPDFGLSIQPPPDGAFHYEHLLEDEFVLLCPSGQPLSRHKTCRWVDFKDYPSSRDQAPQAFKCLPLPYFKSSTLRSHTRTNAATCT
jgi:LysR substrate binding domain-containing protein